MKHDLSSHYALLLGLNSDWRVRDVQLDLDAQKVTISVEHCGTSVVCPCCKTNTTRADHAPERTWRHLDTMQFETCIQARTPRADCKTCGVKTAEVPWAGKHSHFTWMFEAFTIAALQTAATIKAACKLLGLSWDSAHAIMTRAVDRGLESRDVSQVQRVGIDEKSFLKGQDYVTNLCDLDGSRVLDVVQGRTEQATTQLFGSLPEEVRRTINAVAMDMWPAYIKSAGENLPNAEIVFDRFHVAQHMGQAVDTVRRQEHKQLLREGEDTLTGTRYFWLRSGEDKLREEQKEHFARLKKMNLKTGRAWALKEMLHDLWYCRDEATAQDHYEAWYSWAIRSKLEPVKKVARMVKKHVKGILAYFRHYITNAKSEGLNSRIQAIKSAARGFRNFENYRIRILFFCGRLKMLPPSTH